MFLYNVLWSCNETQLAYIIKIYYMIPIDGTVDTQVLKIYGHYTHTVTIILFYSLNQEKSNQTLEKIHYNVHMYSGFLEDLQERFNRPPIMKTILRLLESLHQ